ncbi:hypothetical protein GCM10011517_28220 [Actibacterium pelagium]|uniref:Uncharacterized protein n=1 Tax=Actibacterium pelagium TaxID=2029103 RepID=A0A917ELY5_9RHOB|nr:hypothetical protein GCM10011517_28220 [Actibacterium pelagium]
MAGHARSPDIIGDMASHFGLGQAKVAAVNEVRHMVRSMVAGHDPIRLSLGAEDLEWLLCHAIVT